MIQPVFPRFCHPWSTLSSHLFPINVPFCSVVFLGFFPPSYCSMFYFSLVHDSPHQGSLILLGTNFYFDLWNLTLLCPLCTHPPLLCTNPFSPFVCVCVCVQVLLISGTLSHICRQFRVCRYFFFYFTVILFWVNDLLLLFFFSTLLYTVFRKKNGKI